MKAIEYSKSLIGEFHPIVEKLKGMGGLSFLDEKRPLYVPNLSVYVTPVFLRFNLMMKWRITPLINKKVIISCRHPKTNGTWVLGYGPIGQNNEVFIEDKDLPNYFEEVLPRNQFELIYIEDSPLFFRIRSSNLTYLSAGVDTNLALDPGFVACFLHEKYKKYEYVENHCSWYLALDDKLKNPKALNLLLAQK